MVHNKIFEKVNGTCGELNNDAWKSFMQLFFIIAWAFTGLAIVENNAYLFILRFPSAYMVRYLERGLGILFSFV